MKHSRLTRYRGVRIAQTRVTEVHNQHVADRLASEHDLKALICTQKDGTLSIGVKMKDGTVRVYDTRQFNVSEYAVERRPLTMEENWQIIEARMELGELFKYKDVFCYIFGYDAWHNRYNELSKLIERLKS